MPEYKDARFSIRVNSTELEEIKEAAKSLDMTFGDFILYAVRDKMALKKGTMDDLELHKRLLAVEHAIEAFQLSQERKTITNTDNAPTTEPTVPATSQAA